MSRLQTLRDIVNKADQAALIITELTVDHKSYEAMVLQIFMLDPTFVDCLTSAHFNYTTPYNTVTVKKAKE